MLKKILIASLIAATWGSVPLVTSAAPVVVITQAPPPPRVEPVPHPRHGYVWAPGHWEWRHGRHEWVAGHWLRERHGEHWVADNWVERGGHWERHPGHWERGAADRDHDGVPNRADAHPDDPHRS